MRKKGNDADTGADRLNCNYLLMEALTLKTSAEWYETYPIQIIDADGWDRDNFKYSWYEELITFSEFDRRVMASVYETKKP